MVARSSLGVPVMAEAKPRDGGQSRAQETSAQSPVLAVGRPDLQELSCQCPVRAFIGGSHSVALVSSASPHQPRQMRGLVHVVRRTEVNGLPGHQPPKSLQLF